MTPPDEDNAIVPTPVRGTAVTVVAPVAVPWLSAAAVATNTVVRTNAERNETVS